MATNHKICPKCNGWGHDKAGRPVTKMERRYDKKLGRERDFHVTVHQGSGCVKCCGLGRVDK